MLNWMLRKIMGTKNERELRRLAPMVVRVNELEPRMKALRTEEMPRLTAEWKEQVQKGRKLEDVLPEAFALVREASVRTLGMRHFDVAAHRRQRPPRGQDRRDEDRRGQDPRRHLALLPERARRARRPRRHGERLPGPARREWMGRLYGALGMRTGVVVHGLTDAERQHAYGADITYGQNNEFGFDYLRDNMKFRLAGLRAARAQLRHRGRGGLDPHSTRPARRSHLRPLRRVEREVLPGEPASSPR